MFLQLYIMIMLLVKMQHWCTESSESLHFLPWLLHWAKCWRVIILAISYQNLYEFCQNISRVLVVWIDLFYFFNSEKCLCGGTKKKDWCFRCLKSLQQVKHEYSLVKSKLQTLFKVRARWEFCVAVWIDFFELIY